MLKCPRPCALAGLTNCTETRFFLRVTLKAKPVVVLHLPKLPRPAEFREKGYASRAGDNEEALGAAVAGDVIRYAQSLLHRFTAASEVRRRFEDGTCRPHLRVEDQAWIF